MAETELAQEVETARAINIHLASRVMGWTQWTNLDEDCPCEPGVTYFADWGDLFGVAVYEPEGGGDVSFCFNPAEEIADAMKVVDKLKADDFWPSMTWQSGIFEDDWNRAAWFVRFRCVRAGTRGDHWAADESLPLAICLAARKVVERTK